MVLGVEVTFWKSDRLLLSQRTIWYKRKVASLDQRIIVDQMTKTIDEFFHVENRYMELSARPKNQPVAGISYFRCVNDSNTREVWAAEFTSRNGVSIRGLSSEAAGVLG